MAGNGLQPHQAVVSRPNAQGNANRPKPRGGVDKYDLDHGWQATEGVKWAEVDAALIADCIAAVTGASDAIMFACTSDGGAYSVTVMSGGRSVKAWPSDKDGVEALLLNITERAQPR